MAYHNKDAYEDLKTLDVVRCVQNGDHELFEILVRRYQDRVYNTALRLIGNADDAADITQEVFLNCFRKIDLFRGDSEFLTWLYRITVNMVKNRWTYRERRGYGKTYSLFDVEHEDDRPLEAKLKSTSPGPHDLARDRELKDILMEKMGEIDPDYREVLVLRCVEQLSYEEIADVLNTSIGTVKSRIHRARELIRRKMEKYI
ncbi:sigma-70 family RNA polymerase sigma factor [Candidatus Sumerlaeota bacterium]|nr:sigma-70 family RNA polymerase sigma factor [Candidatus Sumerlaeota bacterium]